LFKEFYLIYQSKFFIFPLKMIHSFKAVRAHMKRREAEATGATLPPAATVAETDGRYLVALIILDLVIFVYALMTIFKHVESLGYRMLLVFLVLVVPHASLVVAAAGLYLDYFPKSKAPPRYSGETVMGNMDSRDSMDSARGRLSRYCY